MNGPIAKAGIHPAICSDAVFVRRVYLDVIGTLPTPAEVRTFLADRDPKKRTVLIDRLMARPEFADTWAMKWSDLLRVKAEFPVNLWPNAAQAYHHWLRTSVRDNLSYDRFVREMLTANGSNFRVGPVNFYRAVQNKTPEGLATAVALAFMGTRVETWPTNDLANLAVFFSQVSYKPTREWKEEVVFWDPNQAVAAALAPPPAATNAVEGATNAPAAGRAAVRPPALPRASGEPLAAVFPDQTKVRIPPDRDPREVFADWLITPANPWFTRCIANRIWSWLMGRGLIHEPDDIRPDNPPSNPALLAYLEKEMIGSKYDTRHLFRLILNSQAYQRTSVPAATNAPDPRLFAVYPLRRLDAEVLIDAINQVTGTSDLYTSAIPEPYTFIPENKPAIALPDGSITSPFLELFGRPARATGMENERINRPIPSQWMHLLNSSHIQSKLEKSPVLAALASPKRPPQDIVNDLYVLILSRPPSRTERSAIETYTKSGIAKGRELWTDLAWALINSDEFLYRH